MESNKQTIRQRHHVSPTEIVDDSYERPVPKAPTPLMMGRRANALVTLGETPVEEIEPKSAFQQMVYDAVSYLIESDNTRPIICLSDIADQVLGTEYIALTELKALKKDIATDPRLEQVTLNEYRIVGRDQEVDWVDEAALKQATDAALDLLRSSTEHLTTISSLFLLINEGRRRLTNAECEVVAAYVAAHRFVMSLETDGTLSIWDATGNVVSRPNNKRLHAKETKKDPENRGLSGSQTAERIRELNMRTRYTHRRRP